MLCCWLALAASAPHHDTHQLNAGLVLFGNLQPISDSLSPLPPTPGVFQTLGRLSLPLLPGRLVSQYTKQRL